jgi:hypothetical protein
MLEVPDGVCSVHGGRMGAGGSERQAARAVS